MVASGAPLLRERNTVAGKDQLNEESLTNYKYFPFAWKKFRIFVYAFLKRVKKIHQMVNSFKIFLDVQKEILVCYMFQLITVICFVFFAKGYHTKK